MLYMLDISFLISRGIRIFSFLFRPLFIGGGYGFPVGISRKIGNPGADFPGNPGNPGNLKTAHF